MFIQLYMCHPMALHTYMYYVIKFKNKDLAYVKH